MRAFFLIGLLTGCADQVIENEPDGEPITPYIGGSGVYDEEMQGRWLLGSVPDGLTNLSAGEDHLSVRRDAKNRPGQRVSVEDARLAVRDSSGALLYGGANPEIIGLELESATGEELRVDGARIEPYGAVYQLQYKSAATGGVWTDYCESGGGAVAMQGTWSSTGFHRDTSDISFGCEDGVTYKCFTWTYVPGPAGSMGWRAHQACTRMARFDMCGNGEVHTREETPIVIRDYITGYRDAPGDTPALRRALSLPAPPDRHFYESAWIDGENVGAVCLSRVRWQSLPVGGGCPNLPDPRVTAGAQYCEDMSNDDLQAMALLASASQTQDMFMHRWRNPSTNDVVTTVRGYYSENPADFLRPFPDYTEYVGVDGILLRNLPGSIAQTDVLAVYSAGTTDRVLLPDPTGSPKDPSFEGYLLRYHGEDRAPFYLYNRAGVDQLTSVDPGDSRYVRQSQLGFAIVVR